HRSDARPSSSVHPDSPDSHSFPTRRSSDLTHRRWDAERGAVHVLARLSGHVLEARHEEDLLRAMAGTLREYTGVDAVLIRLLERSEEHTSELQSRENLVCRLLLEKKKNAEK